MKVKVTIVAAKNLRNVEWMGTSDPYCTCWTPGADFKTKVINNNLNPVWNHTSELEWDGESDIVFQIQDSNSVAPDAHMGNYVLPASKVTQGFSGHVQTVLDGKETGDLEIKVSQPYIQSAMPEIPQLSELLQNDLFMWTSKIKSCSVLGFINLVCFVYVAFDLSLLVLLANIGLLAVGIGGVVKLAGLPVEVLPSEFIAKHNVGPIAEKAASAINQLVAFAWHVVLWQDQGTTVKGLVAVYLLSTVSRFMNFSLVAFLVFNGLFIVPVQLQMQKKVIEQQLEPQIKKAFLMKDQLLAKIPKYSQVASKDD